MAVSRQDVSMVYNLLQSGLSQDDATRKKAEAALNECEARPGFCLCLLEIIRSQEIDKKEETRWLAVVYFKNSINKYWRNRRDSSGISLEEKSVLRERLLDLIREENNQVAVQLAVCVSKVARFDFPSDWPTLFATLIGKLQSQDSLLTHRVYLTLNFLLKELSSKRLAADQRTFYEVSAQLYDYTWHHWCSDTSTILSSLAAICSSKDGAALAQAEGQTLSLACDRWVLCLKMLKRILNFGFPSDARTVKEVPGVRTSAPAFLEAAQSFLQAWQQLRQKQHSLASFASKAMLKLMRLLGSVQVTHPYTFGRRPILVPVLEFCFKHTTEPPSAGVGESVKAEVGPFLIECMVFIKEVVSCTAYRAGKAGRVLGEQTAPTTEQEKGGLAAEAQQLIQGFFDRDKVLVLCSALVQRHFTLTQEDLEAWSNDPETFAHEQGMLQWRDNLRPCAEALYLTLFENYREVLAPFMLAMLKQAVDSCPPAPPQANVELSPALLLKEAAYNAVGAAHHDLFDLIDFRSWHQGALSLEAENTSSNGRILRRRVAYLYGQWGAKIKDDLRRPVYRCLMLLLKESDMAVRLAACDSLRSLIDDCNFYEDDFAELVAPCLQLLFEIVQSAQEFDTKVQVFNLVNLIIERLGSKIVPCAGNVVAFLPQVWQQSEGQSLLRIQVLLALQRLINALGPQSTLCYDLLFPMLQHCTDVTQPDEINMLEDGMQVWLAALRHAPLMVPPLMALFPNLVAVMDRSFDHLQVCMRIIESYIFLGGAEFLRHHAQGVVKILDGVVGNVKDAGMLVTLPVIDTLVQCFPNQAPGALEHVLQRLLVLVVAGKDDSDKVKALAASILARVLLQNSAAFVKIVSSPSLPLAIQQQKQQQQQQQPRPLPGMPPPPGGPQPPSGPPLLQFLDAWLDKMDTMASTSKRKVSALALCILLELNEPQILERLELILSFCTSVIRETQAESAGAQFGYDYWVSPVNTEDDGGSPSSEGEGQRRRQVFSADPVNNLSLAALLKEKLQKSAVVYGEAAFNSAMSQVHPSVMAQLQQSLATGASM